MVYDSSKKFTLCLIVGIVREIFKLSLITSFIFLFLEQMQRGFVSGYLNLKIILWICFISGIISLITSGRYSRIHQEIDYSRRSG